MLIVLGAGLVLAPKARAAQAPTGITISPAFQQVSVISSQSSVPVSFTVTNDKQTAQTLNLSAADFDSLNESGGLFFVGAKPTDLQKKYGLAKWLSLPSSQITLLPKQSTIIKASILNQPDLAAGGHYGALMLAVAGTDLGPGGSSNIDVHPVASSLLFVTKLGGDTHDLSLAGVFYSHNLFKLPGSVTLRFNNTGNTHLIPRGLVTIKDSRGKLISKGIINDNSGIILPQTYRRYSVPMQTISIAKSGGIYKINVDFRFDGINQYRGFQASYLLVPLYLILILAIVLAVVVVIIWKHARRHIGRGNSNSLLGKTAKRFSRKSKPE
jgi:hypothetical protein